MISVTATYNNETESFWFHYNLSSQHQSSLFKTVHVGHLYGRVPFWENQSSTSLKTKSIILFPKDLHTYVQYVITIVIFFWITILSYVWYHDMALLVQKQPHFMWTFLQFLLLYWKISSMQIPASHCSNTDPYPSGHCCNIIEKSILI